METSSASTEHQEVVRRPEHAAALPKKSSILDHSKPVVLHPLEQELVVLSVGSRYTEYRSRHQANDGERGGQGGMRKELMMTRYGLRLWTVQWAGVLMVVLSCCGDGEIYEI